MRTDDGGSGGQSNHGGTEDGGNPANVSGHSERRKQPQMDAKANGRRQREPQMNADTAQRSGGASARRMGTRR